MVKFRGFFTGDLLPCLFTKEYYCFTSLLSEEQLIEFRREVPGHLSPVLGNSRIFLKVVPRFSLLLSNP